MIWCNKINYDTLAFHYLVHVYITMATTLETPFFWVQKVVAMVTYYITVTAPLTVPPYPHQGH